MGISSSKSKTTPWGPAQPYILKGMQQTNQVFDANQPRLQDMSNVAYDAFKKMAPDAFSTSPYVSGAQEAAQNIFQGGMASNPGQATYDRLQGAQIDPSLGMLQNIANGAGNNPATTYARNVAEGKYLNAQPSADLYSTVMGDDYLRGNPYLDSMIAQTNADIAKQTNRMFGARGMGSGVGSAFADVLSKNLANNESQLRYQNYNDAANRQLQAAGQSDNIWSGERGRMDAATGLLSNDYNDDQGRRLAAAQALGNQFGQQQDRALEAAKSADAAQQSQVQQMLAALGLTGGLRDAEYAGYAPALNLLNTAADIPYVGTAALNGQIRQASNGYGTTKVTGNIGSQLIDAGTKLGSAYLGRPAG